MGAAIDRASKPRLRLDRWVLVYLYLILAVMAVTLAFVAPRLAVTGALQSYQIVLLHDFAVQVTQIPLEKD